MSWLRRLSTRTDRLADPAPLPWEPSPGFSARIGEPTARLLKALDELGPTQHPTVVLSVTGPDGLAFDLQITTDLPRARDLIDDALADLIQES